MRVPHFIQSPYLIIGSTPAIGGSNVHEVSIQKKARFNQDLANLVRRQSMGFPLTLKTQGRMLNNSLSDAHHLDLNRHIK